MSTTQPTIATELKATTEADMTFLPEPFRSQTGKFESRSLGDAFGLTQFGANLEILQPGAKSALKHYHTKSDELVFVLSGTLVLYLHESAYPMHAGMCVGFKAGTEHGHHLKNESTEPASFIVVGARVGGDEVVYPDDDFMWLIDEKGVRPAHKSGEPY